MFALGVLAGCGGGGGSATGAATSTSASTGTSTSSSSDGSGTSGSAEGSATLAWQPPATYTNGQALTNLSGYRIYYGLSSTNLNESIQVNSASTVTYVVNNLPAGTWYFAIAAVTNTGLQGALSDVVSFTVS
jgi:hypothetical protein